MTLTSKKYVDDNFIKKNSANGIDNNIVGSVGISGNTTIKYSNPLLSMTDTTETVNVKLHVGPNNGMGVFFNNLGGLYRTDGGTDKTVLSYPCDENHVIFHGDIRNNRGASFKPTKIVTSKYNCNISNQSSFPPQKNFFFPISHVDYKENEQPMLLGVSEQWVGYKFAPSSEQLSNFCNTTNYERPGFCYWYSIGYPKPSSVKILHFDDLWYLQACFVDNISFETTMTIEIQCVLNPNFKEI